MNLKSILLTALATLGFTAVTMAQVPNYIPTNGLVGWWPFNGNANDESGNGNNGTIYGAVPTTDRLGNDASAYTFDGQNDFIDTPLGINGNFTNEISIGFWLKGDQIVPDQGMITLRNASQQFTGFTDFNGISFVVSGVGQGVLVINSNVDVIDDNWHYIVGTYNGNELKLYVDNLEIGNLTAPFSQLLIQSTFRFGHDDEPFYGDVRYLNGTLDDIGIWNRALTQEEITSIFTNENCDNNTSITQQSSSLAIGSTAILTATTSDPNPNYIWQSDFGQGFQTLNNIGNYSGANSATLNIANVQLSEHNQPIRVISTSGNCIDTSNVSVINVLDTCITNVIVYDTLLTSVTDTLFINATITGLNPPSNQNTLKVFPNPAKTHITIDYGNFGSMNGYTLTIVSAIGQTVFTTPINQQTSYLDLSTWTGNGIYYVQLLDIQNNTIENRKIVIQ
jgi:hypothetical protein